MPVNASKWRFNFSIKKNQRMSTGYKPDCFVTKPIWYLNENITETVTRLEILGETFTNNDTCSDHVQNRLQKCRRAFYSLRNIGMNYPGLNNKSLICIAQYAYQRLIMVCNVFI